MESSGIVVEEGSIDEQKEFFGKKFPLVLRVQGEQPDPSASLEYISSNKEELLQKLESHGAILFRDFGFQTAEDFNEVVVAFGKEELPYIGGAAPRTRVCGRVFTSNESPPSEPIPFHHEMAQVKTNPGFIWFFCLQAAVEGGATPICLSNVVYNEMVSKFESQVKKIAEVGLMYTRIIDKEDDAKSALGRGWKSTFLTDNQKEAEEKAAALGVEVIWEDGERMKTISRAPGIREGPNGPVFFNQIVAAYTGWKDSRNDNKAVKLGDGTDLDEDFVLYCRDFMEKISVDINWRNGDVLFVDNTQCYHARRSFIPPRKILASLSI